MNCLAETCSVGISLYCLLWVYYENAAVNIEWKQTHIIVYKEIKPALALNLVSHVLPEKKNFSEGKISEYVYIYMVVF